ncbi:MAG TPA: rhodanese-like domain-containing protein [Anaeromyxobacteraceae bacterium]|nr:rhodanese-like domain-containing protein [Anaeromyxobacteraceae bacterium]
MIRTVTPLEAEALLSREDLDVVDVRDPRDWAAGHIPRARPLPLAEITADAKSALPRDGVVFVCAKGIRSLTAAKAAEAIGLQRLYSIEGGTLGWGSAGLQLVSEGGGI